MNAIKKAWNFISEHGYAFMLAGMIVVIIAAIALVRYRQNGETPAVFIWPTVIAGLAVYALGRIGIMAKKRKTNIRSSDNDH